MDCERAIRENIAERYLNGTLDPGLKEEWEQHYFACDQCARLLETWQEIEKPLREMAPGIRREMRPAASRGQWVWLGAAAAVVILVGGVVLLRRTTPPVTPTVAATRPADLTALASLDPPAFTPPVLRGVETPSESKFREAMNSYQQHDWLHAIDGLKATLELDPAAAAPRFFLGACYQLSGSPRDAVAELERVADSGSPFAEEARFDLAKGYLALGRIDDAVTQLRRVAGGRGDFASQAGDLIGRIQGAR